MSVELNGWFWVEWRNTLEPELFRDGRIRDLDGDWIMPAPTRKIGPRIPEPKELKATELELAKLRILVDNLDKTLDETREERDRLWAEVERLRPKEWRFFDAGDGDFWAVTAKSYGVMFGLDSQAWYPSSATLEACLRDQDTELTAHDAYARLDGWPEGQLKFRELTGYEPPTCKESLPVQPEERVRCYLGRDGKLRCYDGYEECLFIDNYEDVHLAQPEQLTIDDGHKRITVAEALGIVRDRPKQIAKLREMAGIAEACYFCGDPATKQGPFPRCDYCEASRQRSIGEGATDSIMYIAEADANRKRLALLMAIPCKEMRM